MFDRLGQEVEGDSTGTAHILEKGRGRKTPSCGLGVGGKREEKYTVSGLGSKKSKLKAGY